MAVRFTRTRRGRRVALPSALAKRMGIKVKAVRKKPEHDDQVALFDDFIKPRLVAGAVAFAIPNGGHRAKSVAAELKAEGATAGVPDIYLIDAGLSFFLEMKALKGGRTSKEQRDMIARLTRAGAICAVCKGLAEAVAQLESWGLLKPENICAIENRFSYFSHQASPGDLS
ncbi:VRR-NUC domain-containing protein [Tardiphaga sp. vice154]|uniref:VRR-NUC domain-containing protein n=1 Tax=Tardiphaga sp. vice154 TaxID=2592814 RepID=UPI001162A7EB|nr:VRR-NUC domain-containing protein [Tardiphaga sp. vice154]QDM22735.1 VRR-NUC domain-containing protein [Tardiphaga sp. vice154]